MQIRKLKTVDLEAVMEIWLQENVRAHDFIDRQYWESNFESVKSALPQAEVYVAEINGEIAGFIGLNADYIEGLFVAAKFQGQGTGKALVDHMKNTHGQLSLRVYRNNEKAVRFYKRNGFDFCGEDEMEYGMDWHRQDRKVILFICQSLDGFIADDKGGVDWITGHDLAYTGDYGYEAFIENIDTVIMGS